MEIIGRMAVDAAVFKIVFVVVAAMAVVATQAGMPVGQREAGLAQMIETYTAPRRGRVAVAAAGPFAAIVNIVDGVATSAGPRCCGKLIIDMTIGTGDIGMTAGQCVACRVMIEDAFAPVYRCVAAVTVAPECAAMDVDIAMAIHAVTGRAAKRFIRRMTALANNLFMSTG